MKKEGLSMVKILKNQGKLEVIHFEHKVLEYFQEIEHNTDYLEELCYKSDAEEVFKVRMELQQQYKNLINYIETYLIDLHKYI